MLQGFLDKEGRVVRNWKRRWFQLTRGQLLYFRARDDVTPRGSVSLRGASVGAIAVSGELHTFCVKSAGRTLMLKATDFDQEQLWVHAIRKSCVN